MFDRRIKADPVARVYSHVESSFDRTLWQKGGKFLEKNFNLDKIKTEWLDDTFPIKRAMADVLGIAPREVENWISPINAYTAVRVLKGWAGKAEVMLFHETFDFRTLESNGISFEKILEPIKTVEDRRELSAYLVSKRSELLRQRGIESGIDARTDAETVSRLKKKYDPIAKELNDYQNRILEYYRDAGMLSQESFNKMKAVNKFYVPFFRFFEEGEKQVANMTGKETGALQSQQVIKKIFGSDRPIIDPLESIIMNTFAMTQQAEKNAFGQKLSAVTAISPRGGKFMERVPPKMVKAFEVSRLEILDAMIKEGKKKEARGEGISADREMVKAIVQMIPESIEKWRPGAWSPGENIVTVFRNGKPTYFETTPEIAKLFKRSGSELEAGIIWKILMVPAKLRRVGAILAPGFIMKNPVRDLVGGVVFTKHTANGIMKDIYEPFGKLMSSLNKDELFVDWMKAGGGMATMQSIDKNVFNIKKGLGKGIQKLNPITRLRRAAEITEEMNRLQEYAKAVESLGKDRWQKEMAAFQSRDISIDFAKMGLRVKAINQAIPFWNARLQGGDKLVRTLTSKDPEVRRNFMTRVAAGIITPSLLFEAMNDGDEEIAELPEVTKDTNWIFRDPVSGEIIKIPVPFETGVVFHGLTRRMFRYTVQKDPNAFNGFFGSIAAAATPGMIPAFGEPFLEKWANKDFWRNRHIIHPSQVGLISEEQYGVYTSETARVIARAMSYMPGVDQYESGLASPAIVEHFIHSWGAGLGRLALNASDAALDKIGISPSVVKPETSLLERLGLNSFHQRFPTSRSKSVDEFYETWGKWSKLEKSVKSKIEKGDRAGAKRIQAEQIKVAPVNMKLMVKAMQQNQALINNVFHNPKITAKEKREMIDKLYLYQIVMARGFVSNINRQKRGKGS